MEKILVDVRVAALEQNYDVWIPTESKLGEIRLLVSAAIAELSGDSYQIEDEAALCSMDKNKVYPTNITVLQAGIEQGECLLLI